MLRIGHRGAAGVAPENTIASFRRAVALGAQAVELDVQRTKDGHLVVMHDDTVDRTTDGIGRVADLTLAQIRRLDAGSWKGTEFAGEHVPTLDEVAEALPPEILLFVEIKGGAARAPGIEEDVLRFIARGAGDRVRASSFDHRVLARLRALDRDIGLGALFECLPADPVALAWGCGATALHPSFGYVVPELVAAAHAKGIEVHTWTVNDPDDIARIRAMRVDGIFSDHPDRLIG
jgi:glycerophosphoryl diester phosphodiesterase